MLERTIALALILGIAYLAMRKFGLKKVMDGSVLSPRIRVINPELPTVLYFWTDSCVQCRTLQKPEILKILDNKDFNLVSLNALVEPEITKELNIKTVPSTAVVSKERMVRFINTGYISGEKLRLQLDQLVN